MTRENRAHRIIVDGNGYCLSNAPFNVRLPLLVSTPTEPYRPIPRALLRSNAAESCFVIHLAPQPNLY